MDITLKNVVEFHETYNQTVGERVTFEIDPTVRKLRHTLISEEYLELLKAESENDMVEIADGICDLKYVLNGTIIVHGLHPYWHLLREGYQPVLDALDNGGDFRIDDYMYSKDDSFIQILLKLDFFIDMKIKEHKLENIFPQLFAEVQRSNMSKTCSNLPDVESTLDKYTKENVEVDYVNKNGKYVIFRKVDNKTLKGIRYSEPDLKTILLAHGFTVL